MTLKKRTNIKRAKDNSLTSFPNDWIYKLLSEKEFRYDREQIKSHIQNKSFFDRGVAKFESQFPNFPEKLSRSLSLEFGLKEIALEEGSLLKYASHTYRIIERVWEEIFNDKPAGNLSNNLGHYNRTKILAYINQNNLNIPSKILKKLSPLKEYEVKCIANCSNVPDIDRSQTKSFSVGDVVGDISEESLRYYQRTPRMLFWRVVDQNGVTWSIHKNNISTNQSKDKIDSDGYYVFDRLTMREMERLFKRVFYFDLQSGNRLPWAQLNSFYSIKYFRDIDSHNISHNSTEPNYYGGNLSPEDRNYKNNPELILGSEYYSRYVNMVIKGYLLHINNPHI